MIKYFGESLIIIDHQAKKIKYGSFYLMMVFHILKKGESEGGSLVMHDRGRKGEKTNSPVVRVEWRATSSSFLNKWWCYFLVRAERSQNRLWIFTRAPLFFCWVWGSRITGLESEDGRIRQAKLSFLLIWWIDYKRGILAIGYCARTIIFFFLNRQHPICCVRHARRFHQVY